jgi:probable phosphoglycerate mutase
MNDGGPGAAASIGPADPAGVAGARIPLIFIRHGETDWNRALRFQGQRDIPLNAHGRAQAARNGRAVAGILAAGEWQLVSSPLDRSAETMRIVLAGAGMAGRPFATDPVLMEAHYGEWEGLTLDEIAARHPESAKARDADKWGYVPPGGESYAMVSERVARLLAALTAPTLVVAHGGILRALLYHLAGLPPHDAPHLAVPQDRVILFTRQAVLTV